MTDTETKPLDFTGEFFMPGKSGRRIEEDHLERYHFASKFVVGRTVLDIACGAGYAAPILVQAGAISYDGVDLNAQLINYDNQTYGANNIRYTIGNICTFDNGRQYDLITCFETIEHVPDYRSALQNLFRLLQPGGKLLISSPNRPITSPQAHTLNAKPSNAFHVQEFLPDELIRALQAVGFTVSPDDLYGQRQRTVHHFWLTRKITRLLKGNPDKITSASVQRVTSLTPRYFILIATKV